MVRLIRQANSRDQALVSYRRMQLTECNLYKNLVAARVRYHGIRVSRLRSASTANPGRLRPSLLFKVRKPNNY